MDRDILDTNEHIEDEESSLRPSSFDEYVGQHDLKRKPSCLCRCCKDA